jgi:NAD(P)-dependent dehydrogenase (short-subunit alcohol dehydrogenase family)
MTIAPGRKALITGGASGFGFEIATRLAEHGAAVAVLDNNAERVTDAAARLGADAVAIHADVRSPADMTRAVATCTGAFGGLDTVVLSAGVIHVKPLEEVTEEDWDRTIDVNLKGAFLAAQATAPALRASGRGRLVAISSDAGHTGFPWIQAYCASKFGLVGLIESIAAELAPHGVTVNCVCPVGCPTTGMGEQLLEWKSAQTHATQEEVMEAAARTNPLGRNATEKDVADAVLYFVSDEASFLTGVALDVDGGARLGGALPGTS